MKKRSLIILVSSIALLLLGCTVKDESSTKNNDNNSKKSNETVLYVTRHGKTMLNTLDRVQGWADTPLTPDGIEVAENLGKGLLKEDIEFVSAYSSDLGRAKETAKTVLKSMENKEQTIEELTELREACYGQFEGDFNKNMMAAIVKENKFDSPEELTNLGMEMWELSADTLAKIDSLKMAETAKTIKDRMRKGITQIAKETEENGGGNVLVVGHGMSISLLLSELSDLPFEGHLPNASVSKITYKDGKLEVESIGDESYIDIGKKEK